MSLENENARILKAVGDGEGFALVASSDHGEGTVILYVSQDSKITQNPYINDYAMVKSLLI